MELHNLKRRKNRIKKSKRVGRGYGSGKGGHTVGRGIKGQKSRSGAKSMLGFEGGNVPLYKRLPKFRGFRNINRVEYAPVNFADLEKNFKAGELVSPKTLKEKGLVKKRARLVKILSKGELTKKLEYSDVKFSKSAAEKIAELGGAKAATAKTAKAKTTSKKATTVAKTAAKKTSAKKSPAKKKETTKKKETPKKKATEESKEKKK